MTSLVVDGRTVAPAELADTRSSRRRGLAGRVADDVDGALVLRPCRHVHTFGMRFAIDVAHLDLDGRVLATRTLVPRRFGPVVRGTRSVVEAAAGRFGLWGLREGSAVAVVR